MKLDSIKTDQRLYVIAYGKGYSCLGFEVVAERTKRLFDELQRRGLAPQSYLLTAALGTNDAFEYYNILMQMAEQHHKLTGYRFACELTPELIGKEGWRVEVVTSYGETERFWVGKSTGWMPCHLQIERRNSSGGAAVCGAPFKSLRIVSNSRR